MGKSSIIGAFALAGAAFVTGMIGMHGLSPAHAQQVADSRVLAITDICDGGSCQVEKFASCGPGLEGPAFDKSGNLWVVSFASGDIYKITPDGKCASMANTGGGPQGLRFDKQGTLWGVDRVLGLFTLNTTTNKVTFLGNRAVDNFHGIDDLIFDNAGGLYLTDAFGSSALDQHGRVFYRAPNGTYTKIIDNMAFPNGISLSPDEKTLYVDDYNMARVIAVPVVAPGVINVDGAYVFSTLVGGHGPDSSGVDANGNLYVAHFGAGEVVVYAPNGFSYGSIRLPAEAGLRSTNVAFRGGYLYITEADKGEIWRVKTKIPGLTPYGDR